MVIFCRGGWSYGLCCSDGHVLHFRVHPFHIAFVGGVDPFLGCLSDFVLDLPFGGLGFATSSDMLNVFHYTIYGRGLTAIRGYALGSVVASLVTLKTGNRCRVGGIAAINWWERF